MHGLKPLAADGSRAAAVLPWLAAACARPGCDLSAADLTGSCARGEAQLVGIFKDEALIAAGVTQVRDHADGTRSCWVLAVGGSGAKAWRHTLADIEAGALRMGCNLVEFVGRPGWARLLPEYAATSCEAGIHYAKRLR